MKKNYSLILLSLLATTTISLAMDAEGLDLEGKKRRFSNKPAPMLGDGIDVSVERNKRGRPSSVPEFAPEDATAGAGERVDSSYALSVLPTVLSSGRDTSWDDQIMKEARDVLAVMQGAVSTDTLTDLYDLLTFARNGGISFGDEKSFVEGLKIALNVFSTLGEQENYIETVLGSFVAQNPHLAGLEASPSDDKAGESGYSPQGDDGLEEYEYGEDPEATSYSFRAEDDGAEDEGDDDDDLGSVDYGSDEDDGNEEYGEEPEAANYGFRGDEGEGEEEDYDDDNDEDEGESDGRSSSSGSSESESETHEDDGRYEEETQSILTVIKREEGFDVDLSSKAIKGILMCIHEERVVLAEGKPTVDMLRETLRGLSTFEGQLDYIDELGTAFISQNPGLVVESPRDSSSSEDDDED